MFLLNKNYKKITEFRNFKIFKAIFSLKFFEIFQNLPRPVFYLLSHRGKISGLFIFYFDTVRLEHFPRSYM